ncbi:MAG: ABC transporter ATP-binding protein [Betaproteobacteria bacterium]|nr:ABC transporter ATP-binding protein [Betaproteobacteria bacterium]
MLTLRDLVVSLPDGRHGVDGVSLALEAGRCLVLLGESGCGKSLTALSLMRLLPEGVTIAGGQAHLGAQDLFALPERRMRSLRGGRLAMVFQEPMSSLNPVMTIAAQIEEARAAHGSRQTVAELLDDVGLQPQHAQSYPFQLSGGQRQRALIAMMLAGEPEVLIADEPTTALDVTVQAQILRLLRDLQSRRAMALLLITHDLGIAREMGDTVAVLYAGQVVETVAAQDLFASGGRHPYTRALMQVTPSLGRRGQPLLSLPGSVPLAGAWPRGCRFAPRCSAVAPRCREASPALEAGVRCLFPVGAAPASPDPLQDGVPSRAALGSSPSCASASFGAATPREAATEAVLLEIKNLCVHYPLRRGLLQRTVDWVRAVDGVDLRLNRGETLALVGESGCGKSSLARALLRLQPAATVRGQVRLNGEEILNLRGSTLQTLRRCAQIVFQDPFSSLDPRMRVGDSLEEGLQALRPEMDSAARRQQIERMLKRVGLDVSAMPRYPHAFSGGQRQRLAIARALCIEPQLLILDEPTSALDVSVQAQVLALLRELQAEHGLAYLFITHNLPLVGYFADRVAVMQGGKIVEAGAAESVMAAPQHPYTQALLASAPG